MWMSQMEIPDRFETQKKRPRWADLHVLCGGCAMSDGCLVILCIELQRQSPSYFGNHRSESRFYALYDARVDGRNDRVSPRRMYRPTIREIKQCSAGILHAVLPFLPRPSANIHMPPVGAVLCCAPSPPCECMVLTVSFPWRTSKNEWFGSF